LGRRGPFALLRGLGGVLRGGLGTEFRVLDRCRCSNVRRRASGHDLSTGDLGEQSSIVQRQQADDGIVGVRLYTDGGPEHQSS
jgi:hypothetical protein